MAPFTRSTTRLRAWSRGLDPYTVWPIAIMLLLVAVSGVNEMVFVPLMRAVQAPLPIIIVATPTAQITMSRVLHRQVQAPAAARESALSVPTPEPSPAPATAPAPAEPQFVVLAVPQPEQPPPAPTQALPPPTAVPTAAPAAPAPTQHIIVTTYNPDGSIFTQYECKPYGDWRDSNPMYAHPECAQP
jgi:hypothetical protein